MIVSSFLFFVSQEVSTFLGGPWRSIDRGFKIVLFTIFGGLNDSALPLKHVLQGLYWGFLLGFNLILWFICLSKRFTRKSYLLDLVICLDCCSKRVGFLFGWGDDFIAFEILVGSGVSERVVPFSSLVGCVLHLLEDGVCLAVLLGLYGVPLSHWVIRCLHILLKHSLQTRNTALCYN